MTSKRMCELITVGLLKGFSLTRVHLFDDITDHLDDCGLQALRHAETLHFCLNVTDLNQQIDRVSTFTSCSFVSTDFSRALWNI